MKIKIDITGQESLAAHLLDIEYTKAELVITTPNQHIGELVEIALGNSCAMSFIADDKPNADPELSDRILRMLVKSPEPLSEADIQAALKKLRDVRR